MTFYRATPRLNALQNGYTTGPKCLGPIIFIRFAYRKRPRFGPSIAKVKLMGYQMLNENQAVATNGKDSHKHVDYDKVMELGRELLIALGEDPEREGLKDTPRRWASWWQEFIEYQPGTTDTSFEPITTDQMVVISGMRIYSLCEHHLLPFWCDVSIGYVVHEKVLGLSKFARIAQKVAHRLQLQERIVHDIAN